MLLIDLSPLTSRFVMGCLPSFTGDKSGHLQTFELSPEHKRHPTSYIMGSGIMAESGVSCSAWEVLSFPMAVMVALPLMP